MSTDIHKYLDRLWLHLVSITLATPSGALRCGLLSDGAHANLSSRVELCIKLPTLPDFFPRSVQSYDIRSVITDGVSGMPPSMMAHAVLSTTVLLTGQFGAPVELLLRHTW